MGDYDVLTFDPYFCDLIVTGLPRLPDLGLDLFGTDMGIEAGGTFNSVRAMHRLGLRVGWATDFGTDLFSSFVLSEARKEGLDPSLFRMRDGPVRIFSLAFSYRHDRGFVGFREKVRQVDRVPLVRKHRPRAILLATLDTTKAGLALAWVAKEVGATLFLDSQWTTKTLKSKGVRDMLGASDVVLVNASEAMAITGEPDRDTAGRVLAGIAPLVVLKCGGDGAYAYRGSEAPVHAPGLAVDVVDTTGAGDCFNAGFIAAQLRGATLMDCLRQGNICGGLSTTAHGTVMAPTLAEVTRRMTG